MSRLRQGESVYMVIFGEGFGHRAPVSGRTHKTMKKYDYRTARLSILLEI